MTLVNFKKSQKLEHVTYDIRGPVLDEAQRMEAEGIRIIKLNIGNPQPFGFLAPEELAADVAANLDNASGYCASKGLFSARKAIMQAAQERQIPGVTIEDIFIGNGVSELINVVTTALLDAGDEILIPSPDYPLWTASTNLAGGKAVHYLCDENQGWFPDVADIRRKVSHKTKAIVVINPNNPTGAVYSKALLQEIVAVADEFGLIIFADEIYDKTLYDEAKHISIASLSPVNLCITFNGLSKNYRACGYRAGWMVLSGDKAAAADYISGLTMLSSMRICSNVPSQYAIQTALGGYQSIDDLVAPTGRLSKQRDLAYELLTAIPGVSCVKPQGALYMFPRLDPLIYPIVDDQLFILELLKAQRVLLVQGSGFNWHNPDHFRVVFLPHAEDLTVAISRIADFLASYRQKMGTEHLV
jgi:alanine-synthesizing transaminase